MNRAHRTCIVLLGAAAAACGKDPQPAEKAPVAPVAVTTSPASAATPAAAQEPCPATGKWSVCAIEKRLRRSGFVAKQIPADTARRPGFSVRPFSYTLGHGRLELFIYPDEGSLAKDIALIDTIIVAPPGIQPEWPSPPKLVRSGNLAAVYMDQTPRQAERLELAITAGATSAR
jgi:hypothetical protein